MQNQQLMSGLEEFFQSSYPMSSTVSTVSAGISSNETTDVVTNSTSSGKFLVNLIVIGGLVFLVYYLSNNYLKLYKQDERNQRF
jgi:preprotein translocase subunit SecG